MESEIDDSLSTKRRKTEISERDSNNDNASEDGVPSEDYDSFLQDYLNRRPKNNLPLFERVIKHEETEAKERDPADDLKLYKDACADFADCVMDITELKASKPEGWKDKINELRKEAAFITLIMKKLNRVEKTRTKISRERVNKERHQVDVAQLKLDNLLCEIQHLRREINKCLKFKSRPLGIDLIPVQEFYDKSPTTVSKPEITKVDEHQLQLARLEWELTQRKELATLLNDLEDKKSHITEQIEKKEKDLNSLAPLIKEVLVVTQPLQDKLGISPFKSLPMSDYTSLLPEPLYFLYIQAVAFSDACDKDVSVDIKGNISEARRFKSHLLREEEKTSEEDSELEEGSLSEAKKNSEAKRQKLFTKHPLSVILKILLKDGSKLDLQFNYYKNLHVLAVIPVLNLAPSLCSSSHGLLNSSTLLSNLFQGDSGIESPNLKNYYQLKKVGLECFNNEKYGTPYVWVQRMGGLNFLGIDGKVEPKQDVSRANMPVIIKELKRRCHYRLSLISLMEDFERGVILAPKDMRSIKLCCSLKSWKCSSWSEISENSSLEHLKDSCFISRNDMFFKGIVSRDEAKLNLYISVKCDYPLSPSVIFLEMELGNERSTSKNNSGIRDIEREVNFYWKELLTSRTEASSSLSYQIFKTMACFDILLESINAEKFPSDKNVLHLHRGRNRSLPFKFLPEDLLFVQRN
ncbi:THO complex subunit 5 homolog [Halyomorpha halys]|uniref:THO complex subunit 5 homolog n=1 Tax=Halyomorpha halys TaxID=286706 RepID=UPI0006D4FFBD|nr:THO complex subunit 5 homolog [Halyomorpha halys]